MDPRDDSKLFSAPRSGATGRFSARPIVGAMAAHSGMIHDDTIPTRGLAEDTPMIAN